MDATILWREALHNIAVTGFRYFLPLFIIVLLSIYYDSYKFFIKTKKKVSSLIYPIVVSIHFIYFLDIFLVGINISTYSQILRTGTDWFAIFIRLVDYILDNLFAGYTLIISIVGLFILPYFFPVLSKRSLTLIIILYWLMSLFALFIIAPWQYEQIIFERRICFGLSCPYGGSQ